MTHYIVPWSPLTQPGSIILATILFVITGILLYLGTRLHHPLAARRPGRFVGACLVAIFLLSAISFLVAATAEGQALVQQIGPVSGPANHITPITLACGVIAFVVILYLTSGRGTTPIAPKRFWMAVGSAVVGTIAAPLIFELPFDLIVIGRAYYPTPHALFALLYFCPLFVVEISSIAMLTFSPSMRLSRLTLFLLAGMFFVFAVWAVFGFTYPSIPISYICNATSKILAFAAAVSLFITRQSAAPAPPVPTGRLAVRAAAQLLNTDETVGLELASGFRRASARPGQRSACTSGWTHASVSRDHSFRLATFIALL